MTTLKWERDKNQAETENIFKEESANQIMFPKVLHTNINTDETRARKTYFNPSLTEDTVSCRIILQGVIWMYIKTQWKAFWMVYYLHRHTISYLQHPPLNNAMRERMHTFALYFWVLSYSPVCIFKLYFSSALIECFALLLLFQKSQILLHLWWEPINSCYQQGVCTSS